MSSVNTELKRKLYFTEKIIENERTWFKDGQQGEKKTF